MIMHWINLNEQQPANNEEVLIYGKLYEISNRTFYLSTYDRGYFNYIFYDRGLIEIRPYYEVTHWLELTPPSGTFHIAKSFTRLQEEWISTMIQDWAKEMDGTINSNSDLPSMCQKLIESLWRSTTLSTDDKTVNTHKTFKQGEVNPDIVGEFNKERN